MVAFAEGLPTSLAEYVPKIHVVPFDSAYPGERAPASRAGVCCKGSCVSSASSRRSMCCMRALDPRSGWMRSRSRAVLSWNVCCLPRSRRPTSFEFGTWRRIRPDPRAARRGPHRGVQARLHQRPALPAAHQTHPRRGASSAGHRGSASGSGGICTGICGNRGAVRRRGRAVSWQSDDGRRCCMWQRERWAGLLGAATACHIMVWHVVALQAVPWDGPGSEDGAQATAIAPRGQGCARGAAVVAWHGIAET